MIAGIGLLGILIVAVGVALLGGDDPSAAGSPTPSPTADSPSAPGSPASAAPSATGTPSGSSAASPSAAPTGPVAVDGIAVTTVERLSVRSGPSTSAERLGSLAVGTPSFVVAGPTMAEGYPWYLVSALGLPPNSGCVGPVETDPFNCPGWFGWVAGANRAGDPWLTPGEPRCPEEPLTAEGLILGRTAIERLACLGGDPFTFRAYWPVIPDDAGPGGACTAEATPSGWLLCQYSRDDWVTIDEAEGFGGVGAPIATDPASGVVLPERGTWIELTVHLDDPAAQRCGTDAVGAMAEERTPEAWVLACRAEMVVESATAVDGP